MPKIMLSLVMIFSLAFGAVHTVSAPAEAQIFGSSKKKTAKRKAKIMKMHDEVLRDLYKEESKAKSILNKGYGYAVFSNVGVNVILVSAGGGKGVAINRKTGKRTYMKMGSAGVGLGLGIKDFRAVFIFHTKSAFDAFVDKGWDFSGQADAAAKSGDKGGEASGAANIGNGVTVYQMTKAGLALQATLQGTKYWKNKTLNK